ncbi:MAG: exonuclease SbcCD subunit D [Muribaculaceae bacterium]|nr:exonuclease SbcCD subunit D [Muribaculaceae bacterium]
MLFIHTSDWHIGQSFYNYSRDDEHRYFAKHLREIIISHKPDALIVSGDIFDVSVPTVQAQRLLVEIISSIHDACPQMKIIIIAGNHDSASRLDIHAPIWHHLNVEIIGTVNTDNPADNIIKVTSADGKHVGNIVAVPYIAEYNYRRIGLTVCADEDSPEKMIGQFYQKLTDIAAEDNLPVVIAAHLAVNGCDSCGHDESKLSYHPLSMIGDGYDYLALGHIHHPATLKSGNMTARYCGTPFSLSFDEDFIHSVSVVSIDSHGSSPDITEITIPSLKKTITVPENPVDEQETLKLVNDLPKSNGDYIRVNILSDKPVNIALRHKIEEILVDKGYRFCLVQAISKSVVKRSEAKVETVNTETLRNTDPIEIARSYYSSRYNGQSLPDYIEDCLKEAIVRADKELREDSL